MTFTILLKPYVWKKSSSLVKCKMLFANETAGFLDFNYLKNYWRYKVDFLYAGTYLLKLQINNVILGGHDQLCPFMHKEGIKALKSQKLRKV